MNDIVQNHVTCGTPIPNIYDRCEAVVLPFEKETHVANQTAHLGTENSM